VIAWGRIPWPLWILFALTVWGLAVLEISASGPTAVKILVPVITVAWLYLLLRGIRWVWIVTIGIYALSFIQYSLFEDPEWIATTTALVGTLLLLLPVTRQFFSHDTVVGNEE
jgi:hypothetical protein